MTITNVEIDQIANSIEPLIMNRRKSTKSENQNIHDRVERMVYAIEAIDDNEFDLHPFSISEKVLFFRSLMEILDQETPVLKKYFDKVDTSRKNPNRKLLYNLRSEDVDLCLDQFIRELFARNDEANLSILSTKERSFIPNYQYSRGDSEKVKEEFLMDIKIQIRYYNNYVDTYKKYMKVYLTEISRHNNGKINNGIYNPMKFLFVVDMYMDVFSFLLLQTVNYCIIKSNKISYGQKENILDNIYQQAINDRPVLKSGTKQNILWSFAVYVFFLTRRNSFRTELLVQKKLEEQMNEAGYSKEVPKRYRYSYLKIDDVLTRKELREIVMEGGEEKEERFNKRLDEIKELMEILTMTAGRDLYPDNLQQVKVVYREVIEDDLQYEVCPGKIRTANTIVRHIKNPATPLYEEISSTIFLREKISRGFFRELGLADLYIKKNKIQECLYEDILSAFIGYDEIQIARNLKKVYSKYNKIFEKEYFNKY